MRVALTGPDGDRGSLGEGLRALGVETLGFPLLGLHQAEGLAGLAKLIRSGPGPYDFVAFTSPRAVEALAGFAESSGVSPTEFRFCFAVGPRTAESAVEAGWEILATGPGPGAAALLEELDRLSRQDPLPGKRVLLPASAPAPPDLPEGLRGWGIP